MQGERQRWPLGAERALEGVWRVLAHPHLDWALWGACLLAAIALSTWPAARSLLGKDATRWSWAEGLWPFRATRVAAALVAAVAALRLLAVILPGWDPAPRHPRHVGAFVLAAEDASAALAQVEAALRGMGLVARQRAARDGVQALSARRRGLAAYTPALASLGLMLAVAAGCVQSAVGWGSDPIALLPEQRVSLGAHTALLAQLEGAPSAWDASTGSGGATSVLSLWEGDRPVGAARLGRWHPWFRDGLLIRQVGQGPALHLSVRDASGAAPALLWLTERQSAEPLAYLQFSAEQQEQQVALPSANLVLRLVYYPQGANDAAPTPHFRAEALSGRDGRVLGELVFSSEADWQVTGLRVVMAPARYIVLQVTRPAGLPLAAVGLALGLMGLAASRIWPAQRLWLAMVGQDGRWRGQVASSSAALAEGMLVLLAPRNDHD
jgi:hypothetical protein